MTGTIPLLSITMEVLKANKDFVNTMIDTCNELSHNPPLEPLREQILHGSVHTIDEMRAWLKPFGYSDTINEETIKFVLCEFVMDKVSTGMLMTWIWLNC